MKTLLLPVYLLCLWVINVTGEHMRVCYYGGWAIYRAPPNDLTSQHIDAHLCTHLVFAFADLVDNGTQLKADTTDDLLSYPPFTSLKQQNPRLKTMLAVGGWNMGSKPFIALVSSTDNMHQFANKTVQFLRNYGFDGLDIDWEYPAARGSPPADKGRFTDLLQIVQNAFEQEPNRGDKDRLLLSVAVGGGEYRARQSYQIHAISNYVDFINVMMYDFHGEWEDTVNVHSSLYSNDELSVDAIIKYWVAHGAPKSKLIVGVPFYGRTFTLANTNNTGVGALHTGKGGYLPYFQICKLIKGRNITEHMLSKDRVPYIVNGDQWVGYDNPQSIFEKAQYVKTNQYGGVMVWAIGLDDTSGSCGDGRYPLMNAVKNGLLGQGTGSGSVVG